MRVMMKRNITTPPAIMLTSSSVIAHPPEVPHWL
jgi:hypothetical protein